MDFNELKALDKEKVANTYARFEVDIDHGKGAVCWDMAGKRYIDLSSGIGVNSLGFCDGGWVRAVSAQAAKLNHTSNLFYTRPQAELGKLLTEMSGMKRVFFSNSGAEANEGAIKCARKYSHDKYGEGRAEILSLKNSFHGRTVTTLASTGQEVFHRHFFPFTEGFTFAPANDIEAFKAAVTPATCAVMMELVQGEGGVVPLDKPFVEAVAKLCEERDILLVLDEVQTGIGRTGSLFAYQQCGLEPDVVTAAKGLGGGLPIGAVLFGDKVKDTMGSGTHGSTFGGGPIVCAGALEVLGRLNGAFLKEVAEKGQYTQERLINMPRVKSVTGMGLMLGAELEDIPSAELVKAGIQAGVICLTAKAKLRLLPPLSITMEELTEGLDILEQVLQSWS